MDIQLIFKTAGGNKKTKEDIEDQLSIFESQMSMYEIFAAIPTFSQYISPMLANAKTQISALELVYDNFEAFSGGDDTISKADRADIEEAAESDDDDASFSEDDLAEIYDMHDMEYEDTDFSISDFDFEGTVTDF